MKKVIAQEDSFGCGIACVAWITNKSYKQAKNRYFKDIGSARTFGYLCKDLIAALAVARKQYSYKYIKGKSKFHDNSIVFIKRSMRYPQDIILLRQKEVGWIHG